MDEQEITLPSLLEERAHQDAATYVIRDAISQAEAELKVDSSRLAASRQIPLSVFGDDLPSCVRSCRVFVLRRNTEFKTERHPNSHQRVRSLRYAGKIRVFTDFDVNALTLQTDSGAAIVDRWVSLDANVWHQPVAGDQNWPVLTFHSADESELIDEYADESGITLAAPDERASEDYSSSNCLPVARR